MVLNRPKKHAGYIEGLEMLYSMRLCANVPAQHAIRTALGGYQSISDLFCRAIRLYMNSVTARGELINDIPGVSCACKTARRVVHVPGDGALNVFNIHDD